MCDLKLSGSTMRKLLLSIGYSEYEVEYNYISREGDISTLDEPTIINTTYGGYRYFVEKVLKYVSETFGSEACSRFIEWDTFARDGSKYVVKFGTLTKCVCGHCKFSDFYQIVIEDTHRVDQSALNNRKHVERLFDTNLHTLIHSFGADKENLLKISYELEMLVSDINRFALNE